ISAFESEREALERSAERVADLFRELGFTGIEIRSAPLPGGNDHSRGAPAVVARKSAAPGLPTVMLYAHHDVQPAGTGWNTDPFTPTEIGTRLYGRGAADDKAGIIAHLGAIKALTTLGLMPDVGIVLFIEGEEEIGSPSFSNFLSENRDLLAADVIVIPDSSNWKVGVPALTTSLRGLVDGTVTVSVLDHAVHSGFFGGPILDANVVLARLIASLHDDAGNVAVAGLYSAPEPKVEYAEADLRKDSSIHGQMALAGSGSLAGRLWTKPALAVIGIDTTSIADSANVLRPTASAKLSLRIPPGQDPKAAAQALEAHLLANAPFDAKVMWELNEAGNPFQAPADSWAMRAARQAFTEAWGVEPVDIGVGGSIPFIALLKEVYPNAEILVTGVEDPDSRAHGANESVHLGELRKAITAEALLLLELAKGFAAK
ncbi:MAG: M20/M25/M40 family metallo-hydrolase, partial [Promicromonosporaceae bacterium]|nr:M20/M25/M40 family metallo-hydrolase [Promicromonosporaceae bacterium]